MHGNVWQWCADSAPGANGKLTAVRRGGGWKHDAIGGRAGNHQVHPAGDKTPDIGFRVARVPANRELVEAHPLEPSQSDAPLPKLKNSLGMEFVLVPKGKFWIGGGNGKPGNTLVEIPYEFYMGQYEVTQGEWEKLMGSNPSHYRNVPDPTKEDPKRLPVDKVSRPDAQAFIVKLNERRQTGGLGVSTAVTGGMGVCLPRRSDD